MNPSSALRIGSVTLRRMTMPDVPLAMELKNLADWNQTESDWRGYLAYEPEGCFVAEVDGCAAGTVTSIRYGERFGWIGMVLVHPDVRRLGIGTTLLRHAIDWLRQGGVPCVKLDATLQGKKVYVPLGFQEEFELSRYAGVAPTVVHADDPRVRALSARELNAVAAFDAIAFGADRTAVLQALGRRKPEWCFVRRDGDEVTGYLIAREGYRAVQLGPWVATDGDVAESLLGEFFSRVAGQRVFVDLPDQNESGGALLRKHGFTVQRAFTRMHLGPNLHPGIPRQIYGGSGAEKG